MMAKVVVASGIVAVLGIISMVAGFAAEATRIKLDRCCYRPSGSTSTPTYSVINILSWIASVVAVILFIAGVVLNNRKGRQQIYNGRLTCYVVKPGFFAAGALFSLFSSFFGIVAYTSVSSSMQMTSQLDIELPVAGVVDISAKNPISSITPEG